MNYQEYVEAVQKRAALIREMKRKDITIYQLDNFKAKKERLESEMRKFISYHAWNMRRFICDNPELFTGETVRIMDNRNNSNYQPLLKVRPDGGLALRMQRFCGEYYEMGNIIVVPKDFILDREAYIQRRTIFMAEKKVKDLELQRTARQETLRKAENNLIETNKKLIEAIEIFEKLKFNC
ncbi:hypothetical protein VPT02_032 [Vibrio phage VPT02]|nr:hypothetical protein VPT02_032 [Vibrio phage VPT02]